MLAVFVFFFKLKTAYEMRMSYWSSDVCSSVLGVALFVDDEDVGFGRVGAEVVGDGRLAVLQHQDDAVGTDLLVDVADRVVDRKSVGSGTSMSVRVTLGGPRILKKKKNS